MNIRIFTVGHSTTGFEKFCEILHNFQIKKLVDVRSYPGSRYVPAFNKENLEIELPKRQIEYTHYKNLGGRRKSCQKEHYVLVEGWKNQAFRNYASYTLTAEYEEGITQLIDEAKQQTVCIMCAESVPWKCHRLIISNTLASRGIEVLHIVGEDTIPHELNRFGAKTLLKDGKVYYPI